MFNQITTVATPRGRGRPTTHRAVQIFNLLLWAGLSASACLWPYLPHTRAIASKRSVTQSVQESDSLEKGKPIEREISGDQSHSYNITMSSGQYLHVVVAQRGID